jgi:molybdopterin-guanine dinucleotide biosynthesis protein A
MQASGTAADAASIPGQAAIPAHGVVLAGGESRRMGEDKRSIDVDGRPLLAHAVAAVAAVCEEVCVVTSRHRPVTDAYGARVTEDVRDGGWGPLAGLEAGLLAARRPLALVLAGDHPGGHPEVLRTLLVRLERAPEVDAVVLGTDRGPQPLVAAYRRHVHAAATRLLESGERRARSLLDAVSVEVLDEAEWRELDTTGGTAVDLDTPDELAAWRSRA